MYEKIKTQIRRGSLSDAYHSIQKELDKYFDLTNKSQRTKYLTLQKLRDNVIEKIRIALKSKKGGYAKGDASIYGIRPTEETIYFTPHKKKDGVLSIEEKYEELVRHAKTKDEKYCETLELLAYEIDEIDKPIIIYGETGTGKYLTVKKIHELSKRRDKPFVEINCAKLTRDNLHIMLFGAEPGSYTDGKKGIQGKVAEAEGGFLFIDEINRASLEVMGTMLDLIEYKKYEKYGGKSKPADIKVILGTNMPPKEMVAEEKMHEDFFHRIKTRIFEFPPLRKRKGDIPLFIDWYCENLKKQKNVSVLVEDEARKLFYKYDWPGNLRELSSYLDQITKLALRKNESIITRKLILSNLPEQLPTSFNKDKLQLEKLLLSRLEQWDPSNGNFVDDFLNPLVAKVYIEDYKSEMKKSDKYKQASKFLGISGLNINTSSLHKFYLKAETES